ncbi:MAG: ABC transporter permease [Ruminococcaceae bacterium]|nr:ABC transporter permease [Oscillospiraceae bacterium]
MNNSAKETVKTHEPLIRLAKRDGVSMPKKIGIRALAIIFALVIDAVFIVLVTKINPFAVYAEIFKATFQTPLRFMWAMRDMVSLLCIGIALAPAFKMRFWNIGAEGQVLMGGFATALCMMFLGQSLPTPVLFLVMLLTSIIAGAVWSFIPAFFKANWNTNETLFTLMMNYVAIQIVAFSTNVLRGQASSLGTINMTTRIGWFPKILGHDFTLNIIIVAVLTVLMYIYLKYTKHGYEISVVGESENTARYAGIDVKKVTIRTLIISGAICGLCGFIIVAGNKHTIATNTAGGNGFTAIIVAWLAKFNTFYMALISFLLIFLEKGASQIASAYGLNEYIADIISGIILFCILGSEFFINYKMIFRHKNNA